MAYRETCPLCKEVVAGPSEKGVKDAAARHQAKQHPTLKVKAK